MNNLKWFLICCLSCLSILCLLKCENKQLNNKINDKDKELLIKENFIKANDISLRKMTKQNDSLKYIIDNYKPEKIVEYKVKYKDTIKVVITPNSDSTYYFNGKKDNFSYNLSINGKKINSYILDYSLDDNFIIIEKDNDIFIKSDNGIIETPVIYKQKNRLSNFKFNTNISVGYGLINKKPDIYIGFGFGYHF